MSIKNFELLTFHTSSLVPWQECYEPFQVLLAPDARAKRE